VDELLRAPGGELGIEGHDHQLLHAEPPDQLRLDLQAGEQLGGRLGPDHGQRVGLEGEDGVAAGDHLPVAEMDAVELTYSQPAGTGLDVGQAGDLHAREA
jgi:hypothetical protein